MIQKQPQRTHPDLLLIGCTVAILLIVELLVVLGVYAESTDEKPKPQHLEEKAKGLDVSHWQGKVRWDIVKRSDIDFAYAKATAGITYTDPEFVSNWHGMREADLLRGAYHFFYAHDDPTAQATHFIQTVQEQTLKPNDLPPVLDVEITDGMTKAQIIEGVLIWLKVVEEEFGQKPIVYTDLFFADEYLTAEECGDYPLWIAEFGVKTPTIPQTWQGKTWTFWQYSQTGKVEGISGDVDLDLFNGSVLEFIQWATMEVDKD